MYKIKSLNRDSISDDDAPTIRKEAQEENALAKYNKALKLQCDHEYLEAESLLESLLHENIPEIESRGGLPKTMSTLKYSCYLNIGRIAAYLGNKQKAYDSYANASELDNSDVTLWFKIGSIALELNHFKQSAYALSKGLKCNENHWPTLDKLIMLLYAMRDSISCLHYISRSLQLDPDYTRGLMLRKRIYEKNPGTQDYYQLFNPDYIYDPPLNTEFDQIEGKELEKESEEIAERICQIEKELEPKPLDVLQLSKPLEEFSWIALGQSIVHMHRFIAENNHSFISEINLLESEHIISNNKKENLTETIRNEPESYKMCTSSEHPNITPIEQETDVPSASEQQENVSDDMETETDQEEPNKQDTDEQNSTKSNNDVEKVQQSNGVEKSNKSKTPKRRRNSLSFLQPWAWHSKRKSSRKNSGKNDKDDTIDGTLRRIIPAHILPNGLKTDKYRTLNALQDDSSLNTMDLYKLFIEDEAQNSDEKIYEQNDECDKQYFGTVEEFQDVQQFWKYPFERCDMIALIEKYVTTVVKFWNYKWPQNLRSIYIEAYEMYREHFDHPQIFSDSIQFETLKVDTEMTLLYSELIFDSVQNSITDQNLNLEQIRHLPCESLSFMELVCTRQTDWASDFINMNVRLHWFKAHVFMVELKNDLAIRSLQSIIYLIEEFTETKELYSLRLPNCNCNFRISLQLAQTFLKSLQMLQKLECVESLFENKRFSEVTDILKEIFQLKMADKHKTKVDRPVQIVMLLHALWFTNRQECFIWTEICLNESWPMYLKSHAQPDSFEHKRWSLVVVKCMVLMEACIKEENIIVVDSIRETQTRLVENLTNIICHQIHSKSIDNETKMPLESVKPWILLHYILQREEHRMQAKRNVRHCKNSDNSDDEQITVPITRSDESEEDEEQEIPASISILFSGHEFLGRRSWCLESNGELLVFLVQAILYRLNAPIFENVREKIEIHLEQAFFCLYQHPSKKNKVSRHLADHNVDPLPLTWNHAQQLYEFYQPKALPEFDSYRYSSISNEMEQLLLRILALVPAEHDPQKLVPQVTDFINGHTHFMPDPLEFSYKVSAMYYLLGDYYLKLHDPTKGLKYFLLDLCINPTRLDTWADMALAMASQLETKLNHCESFKNESDFLDKARSAQICFKQSLQLSNGHSMLWIEYGNFVYMSHSFCSRLLKGDTDMLSMEKFEALESQKEAMLDTAMECFTAANISWHQADPGEHDERWLHHYMLGKIAEKKKQDPSVYLDHYSKAGKLLFENKATYPLKINYTTPQNLSVEALEIHYRIHASILKYLELHEDKPICRSVGRIFQKYLKESDNGLFSKPSSKTDQQEAAAGLKRAFTEVDGTESEITAKKRASHTNITEDVQLLLDDLLNQVEREVTNKNTDVVMIIDSDADTTKPPKTDPIHATKNAQDIMDDLMRQTMANQAENYADIDNENDTNKNQKSVISSKSPSRRGSTTSTAATTTTSNTSSSSDDSSSDDSSDSSSSDSESSETESNSNISANKADDSPMNVEEIKKFIDQCVLSLEQCISRFPQNYKAIYRLTHFYLNNKAYRDLTKCRQLMLSEYTCSDSTQVTGLFCERRNTNFFNGVWRIPTSEIDRPGSFASHMSRCVQIFMQVLRDTDDHKTLLDLCLQLRRTPDPDKIYIRDLERQQLSDQALSFCIQSLRGAVKKLLASTKKDVDTEENDIKLILDIYRSYQKVQKHLTHKESVFSGLLIDAYKQIVHIKAAEGSNILEAAIKFCQTRKAIFRTMLTQQLTSASNSNNTIRTTTPESIPTPTILAATTAVPSGATTTTTSATTSQPSINNPLYQYQNVPLRKNTTKPMPGPGRPRGRPPNINKHLTGASQKSKAMKDNSMYSPSNPYAWQNLLYSTAAMGGGNLDSNIAIKYMMSKYQEELMRHFAQMGQQQSQLYPNMNMLNNVNAALQTKLPTASVLPTKEKSKVYKEKKEKMKTDTNIRYSKETNKTYYGSGGGEASSTLFKDRPGISITPVALTTSPGKTLQQKLAERQKQNPASKMSSTPSSMDLYNTQYQQQQQQRASFAKPNIPLPPVPHNLKSLTNPGTSSSTSGMHYNSKNLSKSIPSSLTIIKSQQPNLLSNSAISISQIPSSSNSNSNKLQQQQHFRKPNPKLGGSSRKLTNEITLTPNYKLPTTTTTSTEMQMKKDTHVHIPLSLSITKKEDSKPVAENQKDNVEIITIE